MSAFTEAIYWRVRRPARKLGMALIWALPRRIVYWAFVRLATFNYDGNPAERTVGDAMRAWGDPGAKG